MTSRSVRSSGRNRNSGSGSDDVHPLVGNYRLLKTIGKGNFAKVKLARHILTGSEVRSQECVSCHTVGHGGFPDTKMLFCIHVSFWNFFN